MNERRPAGERWVSAHLFHCGDLDALLLSTLAALREGGLARPYFFLRYWEAGDHLRLRLAAADGEEELIRRAVTRHCDRCFAGHPSYRADPAGYPERAWALAVFERLDTYAGVLAPNDSVAFLPYRPEYERYGHGDAMRAVERHFLESSRIAATMLAAAADPGRRQTAAFTLLLLSRLAGAAPPESRPPEQNAAMRELIARARFAERYADQSSRLVELDRRVTGFRPGAPQTGIMAVWWWSLTALRDRQRATGEVASDRIPIILDTCGHLLCNRLGLSLPEEAYIRFCADRMHESRPVPEGMP